MRQVTIKPVEPLHLGLTRLTGADLAPVTATAAVTPFPPPSTILGLLGNLRGIRLRHECASWRVSWEILVKQMGAEVNLSSTWVKEPLIWGPLLRVGGSQYYVPLYPNAMLPVSDLEKYLRGEEVKVEKFGVQIRTGVKLARGTKVVERGYRYSAGYTAYVTRNLEAVEVVYLTSLDVKEGSYSARVGGEDRIALVEVSEPEKELFKLYNSEGERAVLLQPLLYSVDGVAALGSVSSLACVEELRVSKVVVEGRERVVGPRAVKWGLGYDEVCRLRRPLYDAIPHGTLLKLRSECEEARAVGLYSQLGYGSLLKL